jgi:hypothetical protein
MKKIMYLLLMLVSVECFSQKKKDDAPYVEVKDGAGIIKKARLVQSNEILIVEGDSIYIVSDEFRLREILGRKASFNVINDPDSVQKILRQRIKAVIVIKHDD